MGFRWSEVQILSARPRRVKRPAVFGGSLVRCPSLSYVVRAVSLPAQPSARPAGTAVGQLAQANFGSPRSSAGRVALAVPRRRKEPWKTTHGSCWSIPRATSDALGGEPRGRGGAGSGSGAERPPRRAIELGSGSGSRLVRWRLALALPGGDLFRRLFRALDRHFYGSGPVDLGEEPLHLAGEALRVAKVELIHRVFHQRVLREGELDPALLDPARDLACDHVPEDVVVRVPWRDRLVETLSLSPRGPQLLDQEIHAGLLNVHPPAPRVVPLAKALLELCQPADSHPAVGTLLRLAKHLGCERLVTRLTAKIHGHLCTIAGSVNAADCSCSQAPATSHFRLWDGTLGGMGGPWERGRSHPHQPSTELPTPDRGPGILTAPDSGLY